eukprot:6764415-Ditylum_brightwellii.AAC.1
MGIVACKGGGKGREGEKTLTSSISGSGSNKEAQVNETEVSSRSRLKSTEEWAKVDSGSDVCAEGSECVSEVDADISGY